MKEWALKYAQMGLAVLPVKPPRLGGESPGKRSYISEWQHKATTDREQIEEWWTKWPDANIGIATGTKSGGLVVIDLDVDEEKGKNGCEFFKKWEAENGALPETAQTITGRGGTHLLYRDSATQRNKQGLYNGVDIRGDGGYFLAPPSLHKNGNTYEWDCAFHIDDIPIAQADNRVIEFLTPKTKSEGQQSFYMPDKLPEGQRTSGLISLIGSQRSRGLSEEAIRAAVKAENEARCEPPLTDEELEREIFPALTRGWKADHPYYEKPDFIKELEEEKDERGFCHLSHFSQVSWDILPEFNCEWLPSDYKGMVVGLSESLQVPLEMAGVAVLIIASLAIQKKFTIHPKPDWYESLNLYSAIIAKPSERKSQTQRAVTEPVYQFEQIENERRQPEITEYQTKKTMLIRQKEGLIKAASSIAKKGKDYVTQADIMNIQEQLDNLEEIHPLRLVADDITAEALITLMKQNDERMAIVSSEGGLFQIMAGIYSKDKSNIDVYLKSYSGDALYVDRKTREPDHLGHPLLTLLLFVQPTVIDEIMQSKEFKGRGLLARFLYVIPKSYVGKRNFDVKAMDPFTVDSYHGKITNLLKIPVPQKPGVITLTDEAYQLTKDFFYEIEPQLVDELEDIGDWAGKLHGQTMRIAGVLHCMRCEDQSDVIPISSDTMSKAIEMGRYFLEHAKAAYRIMGLSDTEEERDAKYILNRLMTNDFNDFNDKNISKRELLRLCQRFKTSEQMQPGLDELVKRGYVKIEKIQTGGKGRPSEAITINPIYLEQEGDRDDR